MRFDLNCDLGENEPQELTQELMRYITSANIACGGHAGDIRTMRGAVKLAAEQGVRIGAHPGIPDRANFGRLPQAISADDFKTFLLQQVSALELIAREVGAALHHIKLHGALYHMVEEQSSLRSAYFEVVHDFWPGCIIFSGAGGPVARDSAEAGVESWGEGFLDRGYADETRLVPRGSPDSVLNVEQFEERLKSLVEQGTIKGGQVDRLLNIEAKTWCIHADSDHALEFARRARQAFDRERA